MTRRKVIFACIFNSSERKASYRKRKKGLIKKTEELATLCGIEACIIIYSSYDPKPVVWPSPSEIQTILVRFNSLSLVDQTKEMLNQESFTRQRINKAEDALRRLVRDNNRRELELFMHMCLAGKAGIQQFEVGKVAEMNLVVHDTVVQITTKMEALKVSGDQRQKPALGSGSQSGNEVMSGFSPPPFATARSGLYAPSATMGSALRNGFDATHLEDLSGSLSKPYVPPAVAVSGGWSEDLRSHMWLPMAAVAPQPDPKDNSSWTFGMDRTRFGGGIGLDDSLHQTPTPSKYQYVLNSVDQPSSSSNPPEDKPN